MGDGRFAGDMVTLVYGKIRSAGRCHQHSVEIDSQRNLRNVFVFALREERMYVTR